MTIILPHPHARSRPPAAPVPETTPHRPRRVYPPALQFLLQPPVTRGLRTAARPTPQRTSFH